MYEVRPGVRGSRAGELGSELHGAGFKSHLLLTSCVSLGKLFSGSSFLISKMGMINQYHGAKSVRCT